MTCLRSSGTERKSFETKDAAETFRDEHPDYRGDVIVLCGRCGKYHCSNPNWLVERPWEVPLDRVRVN